MFNAYLHNNFGSKHFIMAIWQTGVQWAPTPEILQTNYNGALEHVATHFGKWAQRLARAIHRHKNDPETQDARRRSGKGPGKHGLTEEEARLRQEKNDARSDYYWSVHLNKQLQASKGKGGGKGKEHRKDGTKGKKTTPKSFHQMSRDEWWWLEELSSGRLLQRKQDAEAKCGKVQAPDFVMKSDD